MTYCGRCARFTDQEAASARRWSVKSLRELHNAELLTAHAARFPPAPVAAGGSEDHAACAVVMESARAYYVLVQSGVFI